LSRRADADSEVEARLASARHAPIWLHPCLPIPDSRARCFADARPLLELGNMAASSDLASEPNDQIEPVIASDGSAVATPLDFSGSLLGISEKFAGSPRPIDEPFRALELALEAGDLSDALCAKIALASFGDRVFLFQSEAEAWRYAVETMRRHHRIGGRPKRRRLIVCAGASDGAGGLPPGLEGDGDVVLLQTDDPSALATKIDNRTAGILIAPVRTNTGFEVVPGERLLRLRETADEYGLVLAYDESVCGLGRTGMLWAHEWTGAPPDVMVALHRQASAPPLAALVVTQSVARGAPGRPPLVDRAALLAGHAVMDALAAPGFLERVQNLSWRLEDRLAELFYERRGAFTALGGIGLLQGLACPGEAEPLRATLAERGLLTCAMGSFLGIFPRLTVEETEIDAAVSIIDAACARETQ
jgi:acetylornithine/N-succinyldiaminopimelate aminotransferase